ncbi:MAG TPA: glycosyltransferase family 39 protein, partial [Chloroflexota bacterium]
MRRWPWLLPAGIVALAGLLRLLELQYGQYGSDDERLWSLALRSLAAQTLPTSGIRSSIGANNGPFQALLVMPAAALFGAAPIAGSILLALLSTAAVYFLYRFVAEFFGRRPALIAALLFAVSSWSVIYSRRMQGQDMLVPFQVLFFWSAARWLARGRGRDLVLMFVWLAILSQVYILGLVHLASAAVVLALGWRRLVPSLSALGGGIALWVALSGPYFVAALLPALSSFGNISGGNPRIDGASLGLALTMATHKGFQTIAGQAGSVFDATSSVEGVLLWVEEGLCAAGFLYAAWLLMRYAHKRAIIALLLLWAVIPVALFARHSVDLYPYYFVAILPLPAVFTSLLLDAVWSWAGAAALILLSANAVALAGIFFAVIPGYWTKNDYGLPYRYSLDVAARVRELAAQEHTGRVYVDGDMDPSEVMSSLLARAGLDVFWFDDYRTPEFAAAPAGDPQSLYVTMADDTDTAAFLRERFAARQALAFPLPGEGVTIRAYQMAPAEARRALDQLLTERLDLRVANGTLLQAFHGDRRLEPGRSLHAALSWSWPGGARPRERYTAFAHLVDGSGKELARADSPLQPTQDWAAGQEVVQWFDLPLPAGTPPGRYALEVGFYGHEVTRQELSDANGRSLGGSVALGPFVVAPSQAPAPSGSAEA